MLDPSIDRRQGRAPQPRPNEHSPAPHDHAAPGTTTACRAHTALAAETGHSIVLSRSFQSSVVGRSASMRRMRRRTSSAVRLYCATNGCTSFLELDPATGVATCPVCGYRRRLD
jgi:hypothetical protein